MNFKVLVDIDVCEVVYIGLCKCGLGYSVCCDVCGGRRRVGGRWWAPVETLSKPFAVFSFKAQICQCKLNVCVCVCSVLKVAQSDDF